MATDPNNITIPSREQFGLSPIDEVRRDQVTPALTIAAPGIIPTGQLDWIMSTIARLESRLSANDRRMYDHRAPPRPDPDPPYALPLSAAVRDSQLPQQPFHTAVLDHQFPQQPFPTPSTHNMPHYPEVNPNNRPPQPAFLPVQPIHNYNPPPLYASEPFGPPRNVHHNIQPGQQLLQPHGYYSPLPGPRPTSCWYPSADRPPRNHHSHAEYRQLQQEYQPLQPIPPPPPQSHHCSAAPLLAAAPPPPPASISPPCRVTSSALDEEIETTNLVEVKPGLRVKASQLKPEITQTENTIFKIGEEGEVLDDDPPPPAAISLPCNPGISPVLVFVLTDAGPHAVPHDICILAKVLK